MHVWGHWKCTSEKMIFLDYCDKAVNLCYRTAMNYWIITHLLRINKILHKYWFKKSLEANKNMNWVWRLFSLGFLIFLSSHICILLLNMWHSKKKKKDPWHTLITLKQLLIFFQFHRLYISLWCQSLFLYLLKIIRTISQPEIGNEEPIYSP